MAHEIDQTTGKAACFVAGEPAWHRLGVVIEKATTSAKAIKLAGLDWEVQQWPVRAFNPDKPTQEAGCPGRVANVRTDTNAVLGVVSSDYRVWQNRDAFDFMDALVGDRLAMYETAGALKGGRRVWMLAGIPKEYRAAKKSDDVVKPYVLLTTGHDGKSPVQMFPTTVRVVCNNTLRLALSQRKGQARKSGGEVEGLTISHFTIIDQRIGEAREKLGVVVASFDEFDREMHAMIAKQLKPADVTKYFRDQLPDTNGKSDLSRKLCETKLEALQANFENPRQTLPGIKGTVWAAYNAVSEWSDHQRPVAGKTELEKLDSQVNSNWFGGSHDTKRKAWDAALALV